MLGTTPIPHLTINYRGDGQGARKIAPIGWTVTEILLIESVVGPTRHVEHGRWSLRAAPHSSDGLTGTPRGSER